LIQLTDNLQNRQLREELQYITDTYTGEEVERQVELITELPERYPHSIRLLSKAIPYRPETFRFNCHQYAFDLLQSEEVRLTGSKYNKFPNKDYVAWLIENELIEVTVSQAQDGDFVVYFSSGQVKHSGVYRNRKVHSKWGLCHLWEHAIHEVPTSYGDEVSFFRKIDRERCIVAFVRFAEANIA